MTERAYPLNAWYAAAWDTEVKRALLPRTICEKPVVLYRKQDGAAVALADACWHRLLPLSMGELYGDNVICGYHGLEFDDTGDVYTCRRRTPSTRRPASNPTRSSSATASSGCGWATRRWPIRRWCPTCTGTTIRPGPPTAS